MMGVGFASSQVMEEAWGITKGVASTSAWPHPKYEPRAGLNAYLVFQAMESGWAFF